MKYFSRYIKPFPRVSRPGNRLKAFSGSTSPFHDIKPTLSLVFRTKEMCVIFSPENNYKRYTNIILYRYNIGKIVFFIARTFQNFNFATATLDLREGKYHMEEARIILTKFLANHDHRWLIIILI